MWRIDQGSSLAGIGADVEVSHATAVALAQLRERCAALCSLLADAAIGRFADELDSGHGLAIRSAPNIVARAGQLADELLEFSDAAKRTLTSGGKRAPVAKRRRA